MKQKAIKPYSELLALSCVKRVYLDELGERESDAVGLYELLIAKEDEAGEAIGAESECD